MPIYEAVSALFELIKLMLILRILLTWFPNVNWWEQPFKFLREFTDPVLEPFKKMIPPVAGIDFSPIVLFILLNIAQKMILGFLTF